MLIFSFCSTKRLWLNFMQGETKEESHQLSVLQLTSLLSWRNFSQLFKFNDKLKYILGERINQATMKPDDPSAVTKSMLRFRKLSAYGRLQGTEIENIKILKMTSPMPLRVAVVVWCHLTIYWSARLNISSDTHLFPRHCEKMFLCRV